MKKVNLFRNIESSVIGFGCAPILGAVDSKTAKIAVDYAIERGVNHFDLARSYGYGDAENFVGKLLKPHRKEIVIATKFGIRANYKAKFLKPVKPLVRQLISFKKKKSVKKEVESLNSESNFIADLFHDRINLDIVQMNKSLENSLKALKTDYIDYFFIHEPLETITNIEELIEESYNFKKAGKIRAFGIAYTQNQVDLHKDYLTDFDVLQFNNSPGMPDYEKLVIDRGNRPNVFFSPLREGTQKLSVKNKLLKLNKDFPNSVILCSMFNTNHILANTDLFNNQ